MKFTLALGFVVHGSPEKTWLKRLNHRRNGSFAIPQNVFSGSSCISKLEVADFAQVCLEIFVALFEVL